MINKIFKLTVLIFILPFVFFSCEEDSVEADIDQKAREEIILLDYFKENGITNFQSTGSGLYYVVEQEGEGETVPNGAIVSVHYTGSLLYGNVFDSSLFGDEPFVFQATTGVIVEDYDEEGRPNFDGSVIAGWVEAVSLMRKGEKTRFFIPSHLGYGTRGTSNIPGNSIIFFDVELLDITPL